MCLRSSHQARARVYLASLALGRWFTARGLRVCADRSSVPQVIELGFQLGADGCDRLGG
jgi:hypothetical protein